MPSRPPPLPAPLISTHPRPPPPDAAARVVSVLLTEATAGVLQGDLDPDRLADAKHEIYRQAATSFGDPWRVARVADLEELLAEAAVQRGDLEGAWRCWRAAWWIRRLPSVGDPVLSAHADRIMEALAAATGR